MQQQRLFASFLYVLVLVKFCGQGFSLMYKLSDWKIHQFNLNDKTDVVSELIRPNNVSVNDLPYVARMKTRIVYNTTAKSFEFIRPPLDGFYRFPKIMYTRTDDACFEDSGGEAAAPFGIAAIADWVITDFPQNRRLGIFGATLTPQIIYVQERALNNFVNQILPLLKSPFVLLSAVNDHTIPVNVDLRYGDKNNWYEWNKVMNSSLLLHWYIENLSIRNNPRASTLPIGTWQPSLSDFPLLTYPFENKTMKFLVTDKVHNQHPQFQERMIVAVHCLKIPSSCFHIRQQHSEELFGLSDVDQWKATVQKYAFQLCVHGGGLDPSTKAWETMMLGTIPIIEHSSLDDAYEQLPVAYVQNMTEFVRLKSEKEQQQMMQHWSETLRPYYTPGTRENALFKGRLQIFHWFRQILRPFVLQQKVSTQKAQSAQFSEKQLRYEYGYLHGLPPSILWQFWERYSHPIQTSILAVV